MSSTPTSPDFASDRPIEHIRQDKLGRRAFARKTAAAIARRHNRESFVVALQGAWGCGKSSIKNMVLEALKEGSSTPIVVEFVPWQLRDADTLFSVFFEEIALAIGKAGDQNEERKDKLSSYGKYLTLGGSTIKALGTLGGVVGAPGAKIVELLGEGLGSAAKVALEGGEVIGKQSLKELKEELRESLRGLDRSILVVIDDIDRLEIEEILLIFQLVKANADFPNFTYLLLLQRDAVQTALSRKLGKQSQDYLDKIIQLPIDVPPINEGQRRLLLEEGITEICQSWELPLSEEQKGELGLLWQCGLREMLRYPRDVQRLLNALEFSGALMQGDAGWEVNLADFLGLEALRIQEPQTHARLHGLKSLLTSSKPSSKQELAQRFQLGDVKSDEVQKETPWEQEMGNLISSLSPARKRAGCRILAFLFPRVNSTFLNEDEAKDHLARPSRNPKIPVGDSLYFDRYFALSIPEDQISEAEIEQVIASTGEIAQFTQHLREFRDRDPKLLWRLLHELSQRTDKIPESHALAPLTALLDFGEEMPRQMGFLGDIFDSAANSLAEKLLLKRPSPEKRGELFAQVVDDSSALRLPIRWIWEEEDSNDKANLAHRANGWATKDQLAAIRRLLTQRIKARVDELWSQDEYRVSSAVYFWAQTERENVIEWLAPKIASDDGLKAFLMKFSGREHTVEANPRLTGITFQRDVLEWVRELEEAKERVAAWDTSDWEVIEQAVAQKFVRAATALLRDFPAEAGADNSTENSTEKPEDEASSMTD